MLNNFKFEYKIYGFDDLLVETLNSIDYDEEYGKHLDSKIIYPEKNEFEIMDLVSDCITKTEQISNFRYINLDTAVVKAAYSVNELNNIYLDYLSKIPIRVHPDFDEYCYLTAFLRNFKNNELKSSVKGIHVPEKLISFSPICIGHEYIHSIKDTNYYEFLEKLTFSEVLTNFYELVTVNTSLSDLKNDWRDNKLYLLGEYKDSYNKVHDKNDLNSFDEKVEIGVYLTGIYYALILYNMYKKSPQAILKRLNDVLNHKYTTGKMLDELNIKNINNENIKIFKLEKEMLYS